MAGPHGGRNIDHGGPERKKRGGFLDFPGGIEEGPLGDQDLVPEIRGILARWDRVRAVTEKLALATPVRRRTEVLVPGVRSIDEVLRHIGESEPLFLKDLPRAPYAEGVSFTADLLPDFPAVLARMREVHEKTTAVFEALTAEEAASRITTPLGAPARLTTVLHLAIDHELHHQGQLFVLVRAAGGEVPYWI